MDVVPLHGEETPWMASLALPRISMVGTWMCWIMKKSVECFTWDMSQKQDTMRCKGSSSGGWNNMSLRVRWSAVTVLSRAVVALH